MLKLTSTQQWLLVCVLAVVMLVTRSHHFSDALHLPDASWALFFLAGVYLSGFAAVLGLALLAAAIDYAVIFWGGVSGFCLTVAYPFLFVGYAALWGAGRWYTQQYQPHWRTLLPLSASVIVGVLLCSLVSDGSFYLLTDYYAGINVFNYMQQVVTQYLPHYFSSTLIYVGIAAAVHMVLLTMRGRLQIA